MDFLQGNEWLQQYVFGKIVLLVAIFKSFVFKKLKNNNKKQKQTPPPPPPFAWCHRQESKGH